MRIHLPILLLLACAAAPARAEESPPEPSPAAAEMLQSMREKGILSEEEYEKAYQRQAKYEAEKRESEELPGWLQNWTIGGDARLRYEYIARGELDIGPALNGTHPLDPGTDAINLLTLKGTGNETSYKVRFRIGAEKRFDENFTFGFRIATSTPVTYSTEFADSLALAGNGSFGRTTNDPRSENASFSNYFSSLDIALDRVYLVWHPEWAPAAQITIGKFDNPFVSKYWRDGDRLVWDPDISPSGVALQYRFDLMPETLWLESTAGAFILDQNNQVNVLCTGAVPSCTPAYPVPDDKDPFLLAGQLGLNVRPTETVQFGVRGSYYDYQHIGAQDVAVLLDLGNGGESVQNNPLFQFLAGSNTVPEAKGRIEQAVGDVYLRLTPFGERWPITPFAQYTTLLSASTENHGYGVGVSIGDSNEFAKLVVLWSSLQRNSTVALFTDSDLHDGYTNADGWFIGLERNLTPHVKVGLNYMDSRVIRRPCLAFQGAGTEILCDAASTQVLGGLIEQYRNNLMDHRKRFQVDLSVEF